MDFKHLANEKNITPKSKGNLMGKVLTNSMNCDSPFRLLPNVSTPPSRFTKIINPFESHLIERLHLPTFSPSVFAQVSTPKNEDKFKWNIDDISNIKPADIDETTIDQHDFEEDPMIESAVQEKIHKFFNSEKVLVPSPLSNEVKAVPVILDTPSPASSEKHFCNGSAQTLLTFPPTLPKHVEDILKPYFNYTQDQQQFSKDSSLYRHLFEFENAVKSPECSRQSSPALSTGLSPIQFSPVSATGKVNDGSLCVPMDMPALRECNLSPIGRSPSKESHSACRLSFSGRMSVDASMLVPDMADQMPNNSLSAYLDDNAPLSVHEILNDSTVNWDMEYKHVSLVSPNTSNNSDKMDVSNSNTPHSRIFTSQRKRLSDSFKNEELTANDENKTNDLDIEDFLNRRSSKTKLFRDDLTDAGYQTGGATMSEDSAWSSHLFASTPSKKVN